MSKMVKLGIILAGYVAACLAAVAAVYFHQQWTRGDPAADAASGMYAFGEALMFVGVFGMVALVPTGLALYFLRSSRRFWTALSLASLALAVTALLAASVLVWESIQPLPHSSWNVLVLLAPLRLLGTPLLAAVFLLSGFIAPTRSSRRVFLGAAVIEGVAATAAFLHWFGRYPWR